jgi:hypothetical protein
MTPSERRRGALENFLAFCLRNEYDKDQLVEFFVYNLSDAELERLVAQFKGDASLPPILPQSNEDAVKPTLSRCVNFTFVT